MKPIACLMLIAVVCLQLQPADAQFVGRARVGVRGVGVSPWVYGGGGYRHRYGYGYGGYGYGNSAGGELMGLSTVIRASSDSMLKYEETRSKYIDNRVKWQKAYYDMTSSYQKHVEEKNAKESAIRDKYLANRPSGAPARLSASQFDDVTGQVAWPSALQADSFGAARHRVEQLLEQRARAGGPETSRELRHEISGMLVSLKDQISDFPPADYISARKFLDSLTYETQIAAR